MVGARVPSCFVPVLSTWEHGTGYGARALSGSGSALTAFNSELPPSGDPRSIGLSSRADGNCESGPVQPSLLTALATFFISAPVFVGSFVYQNDRAVIGNR